MRFIPTRLHGIADYVVGLVMIAAPYLFGFADGTAAQWVPMVLGVFSILYSLLTDYELGLVKAIPMPGHLALDAFVGIALIASPFLFGFADRVLAPHLVLGALAVLFSLTTETRPRAQRMQPA